MGGGQTDTQMTDEQLLMHVEREIEHAYGLVLNQKEIAKSVYRSLSHNDMLRFLSHVKIDKVGRHRQSSFYETHHPGALVNTAKVYCVRQLMDVRELTSLSMAIGLMPGWNTIS